MQIPELDITELEPTTKEPNMSFSEANPVDLVLDIHEELTFFQKLRRGTVHDKRLGELQTSSTITTGKGKDKSIAGLPSRRALQWQMSVLCSERDSLISVAQQLIDQFVPSSYPDSLLRKCWGSLNEIKEVTTMTFRHNC